VLHMHIHMAMDWADFIAGSVVLPNMATIVRYKARVGKRGSV